MIKINKSYSFESSLKHVSNSNFSSFFTSRKSIFLILNIRRIVYSSLLLNRLNFKINNILKV